MKALLPSQVNFLVEVMENAGHRAFVVGGAVRDWLLGRLPSDWDLACSASPAQLEELLAPFRLLDYGRGHGTFPVVVDSLPVEVSCFRGPHQENRRNQDYLLGLETDLAHRDFTVNAMAYDPLEDRLHDPQGGHEDLARRLIRAVGDPRQRFKEDPLRLLRAPRLATELDFALDQTTLEAMKELAPLIKGVAAERIAHELEKLLLAPRPSHGFLLLHHSGLLAEILPELDRCWDYDQKNPHHCHDLFTHTMIALDEVAPILSLRLAALCHDLGKPDTMEEDEDGIRHFYDHHRRSAELTQEIFRRLPFDHHTRDQALLLVREHMFHYRPENTDATVRKLIRRVGAENLPLLAQLRRADKLACGTKEDPEGEYHEFMDRVNRILREKPPLAVTDLALKGSDLLAATGLPPGPWVGETLRALLERVVQEPSLNDREKLLALALTWLPQPAKGGQN